MPIIYFDDDGEDCLAHHGIKGMKWGVRRYQNEDGSLTNAGKNRYIKPDSSIYEEARNKVFEKTGTAIGKDAALKNSLTQINKYEKEHKLNFNDPNFSWSGKPKLTYKEYQKLNKSHQKLWREKHKAYENQYKREIYSKYISKYGKKTFKSSKRASHTETAALIAKTAGLVLTAPISVPIYLLRNR